MNKNQCRELAKSKLSQVTSEALKDITIAICHRLLQLSSFVEARVIVAYQSIQKEPDVSEAVRVQLSKGAMAIFPRYDIKNEHYELAVVEDMDKDFVPGKFGVLEPAAHCRPAGAREIESATWLTPGLAFTRDGVRLGRGGGYYDRLLSLGNTLKIGIACECQVLGQIPTEPHDSLMDMLITEDGMWHCSRT